MTDRADRRRPVAAGAPGGGATEGGVFREEWCAGGYDADRFGGAFGAWLQEREVRLFLDLLEGAPGPLLDAGAGTGKLTLPLLRQGLDVTSIDFSPAMLRHARGKTLEAVRAAGARPGKFAVADLQDLPFRDRRFGTTISSRVLMHVPDWRRAIAHLCRVTDRVLIIDFPVRFSCAGLDACLKGRFGVGTDGARRAYRTFQPGEIRRELVRHGFRIEKSDRGFLLPVALHRALGRPWISAALEFPGRLLGLRALFGSPVTLRAARSQD